MSNPSVSFHGIFYVVVLSYFLFLDVLFRFDRRWLNWMFYVASDDELSLNVLSGRRVAVVRLLLSRSSSWSNRNSRSSSNRNSSSSKISVVTCRLDIFVVHMNTGSCANRVNTVNGLDVL